MNRNSNNAHTFKEVVILLTATVDVRDVSFMDRQDADVRLNDYKQALRLWLKTPDSFSLVFCENSGYDLSEIVQIVEECNPYNKQVELLSFDDNNYSRELGKGYGEIRTIAYAINHSKILKLDALIVKVTGRYYIQNIGSIITGLSQMSESDSYCDLSRNLSWADTRIFCSTIPFLTKFMIPMQEVCNDTEGVTVENILARAVHKCLAQGKSWSMLPCYPDIRGVSGTNGLAYPCSFWFRIKHSLFHCLKAILLAFSC